MDSFLHGHRSRGRRSLRQFVKFNLVGAGNTVVDLLVFALLCRLGFPVPIAQCAAYGCGMLNSYLFNKTWTFQDESGPNPGQLAKFGALNAIVLALSLALLHVLVRQWQLDGLTAKLAVTAATAALNYTGCRRFVFVSKT